MRPQTAQQAADRASSIDTLEWWTSPENIADLIDYLDEQCDIYTPHDAAEVCRKPWHWQPEYELMRARAHEEDAA